jgi:hypothetical protein
MLIPVEQNNKSNVARRFGPDGKITHETMVAVAQRKVHMAVEVFKRTKRSNGKLQYFGIGDEVYTCMISTPDDAVAATFEVQISDEERLRNEIYDLIILSADEAMSFEAVQSETQVEPTSFGF